MTHPTATHQHGPADDESEAEQFFSASDGSPCSDKSENDQESAAAANCNGAAFISKDEDDDVLSSTNLRGRRARRQATTSPKAGADFTVGRAHRRTSMVVVARPPVKNSAAAVVEGDTPLRRKNKLVHDARTNMLSSATESEHTSQTCGNERCASFAAISIAGRTGHHVSPSTTAASIRCTSCEYEYSSGLY